MSLPVPDRRVAAPSRSASPLSDTIVLSWLTGCASAMAVGYAVDLAGLPIQPWLLAACLAISCATLATWLQRGRAADRRDRASSWIFVGVVVVAAAYLLYLASPSLLPVTIGPDVVHHLQLIHLIQRTHRLAHDPALSPYLLEMMNYTPGAHILAAMAGEWLRVDALRVVQPIAALFVALKAGLVYLLALRAWEAGRTEMMRDARRHEDAVLALAAPLLAFAPAVYTLGSSFHFFFFAQVVAETFALGMLLAAFGWMQTRARIHAAVVAACGVGVILSWPVSIGPGVATYGAIVLFAAGSWRDRVDALAIAFTPIAVVAGVHAVLHAEGGRILASAGAVTGPSASAFGVGFLLCAAAGAVLSIVRVRGALPSATFLAFTLLQAAALAVVAVRAGTHGFYMPFKMVYLAVFPAAVLAAIALIWLAALVIARFPRHRRLAAAIPVVVAAVLLAGRIPATRQKSPIDASALAAGEWARAHVDVACVDYFTRHWLTGYWLHLDVLGNPRLSDRMRAETFEFGDSVGKWIEGRGLPFGIVEDIETLPRELRPDVAPVFSAGRFTVLRNARPGRCGAR